METTGVLGVEKVAAEERLKNWLKQCGGGMTNIIPGLFVGSLRDACDEEQLRHHRISHVVSVHDMTKSHPIHDKLGVKVMRVRVSDRPETDLAQHISSVNDFVHEARLGKGNVLVHCLAGASRSVALVVAYLMTVTDSDYWRCLSTVGDRRKCANPNFGFRMQLTKFEAQELDNEQCRMRTKFATKWDDRFLSDSKNLRESRRPLRDFTLASKPMDSPISAINRSTQKQLPYSTSIATPIATINSKPNKGTVSSSNEQQPPRFSQPSHSTSLDSFVQLIKNLNFIDQ